MKHYLKKTRHFLERRGQMLAFLMIALMVSSWIYAFGEEVSASALSTYLG